MAYFLNRFITFQVNNIFVEIKSYLLTQKKTRNVYEGNYKAILKTKLKPVCDKIDSKVIVPRMWLTWLQTATDQ